MVNVNELSPPSTSLKAADLEGSEIELIIASYVIKEFDEVDKKTNETYQVRKPIFSFEETEKTFVCNKTNRSAIAYAYGDEMDEWIGKPITLYPTMVQFGSDMVEAIRVRVVKKGTAKKPSFVKKHDDRNPPPQLDDEVPF